MADDARARRLAAIEARMNPPPSADADAGGESGAAGGSGGSTPRGPPRHLPKTWTRPSPQAERERRRELARILQRTIVRDSGYAQAATCVETLVKIATNIQTSDDVKFRTLKADNGALRSKVFGVPGGRDFLILMGFRTERREFVETFVLDQSERRSYELSLAADVLRDALPDLEARVRGTQVSRTSAKADEARRVEQSRRLIEADRDAVAERVERERLARLAREAKEERERQEQARLETEEDERRGIRRVERAPGSAPTGSDGDVKPASGGDTVGGSSSTTQAHVAPVAAAQHVTPIPQPRARPHPMEPPNAADFDPASHRAGDDSDEYDSDEGYWNQHRWGEGQKLGE